MLLLHEMGETKRIPENLITEYVTSLNKMPIKTFFLSLDEMPKDIHPYRGSPCHCQLGNAYQVMAAWGVDVDLELPWLRPWFLNYQMKNGGLNCDGEAYLVQNEIPGSMVATIAVFEAVLLYTNRPWTTEEENFLSKSANFLLKRKLINGSSTAYNADERESAKSWLKLCFPRFYLYDVLRGLNAILIWKEKTKRQIPLDSINQVVAYMKSYFDKDMIKIERRSFEGISTLFLNEDGTWTGMKPASTFPLLEKVSTVGKVSEFLTKQWKETKRLLD